MITGKTLIDWGFAPASWFKDGIAAANALRAEGRDDEAVLKALRAFVPVETPMRADGLAYGMFLDAGTPQEAENKAGVAAHMDALMRTPTIVAGAVMPDACPSGSAMGTIPVGGVVATRDAIHPGFHSADICCSLAITTLNRRDDLKAVLDAVEAVTHFGPGARKAVVEPPAAIMRAVSGNRFLKDLEGFARFGFATQGDGNHFAFVGTLDSTGKPAIVTHRGSRGLGAQLYKRGMAAARRHTAIHAPKAPPHNAWIDAESDDGREYWAALQIVREWTRESHYAIHDLAARRLGNKVEARFWNEHNFVFRRSDGLFYHGKGATPSYAGFSPDDGRLTMIPLNMAEPVPITAHRDRSDALGFAPHGAGRNMSRTAFMRANAGRAPDELRELHAPGIDVRSYCGMLDVSELPGAYKDAAAVQAQIAKYDLAEVVDRVTPYGSVMAGDCRQDPPWREKARQRAAEKEATAGRRDGHQPPSR